MEEQGAGIRRSSGAFGCVDGAGRPVGSGKLRDLLLQVPELEALAALQTADGLLEDVVHGSAVAAGIVVAGDRAFCPVCAWVAHDVEGVRRV